MLPLRVVQDHQPTRPGALPEHLVTFNQLCGYNIAFFRKAAGLTQDELGERLGGWSAASVSAAERSWDGRRVRKFDADELVAIADALGVPVIALLLPPENAGTQVRYLVDTQGGRRDLVGMLPQMIATYGRPHEGASVSPAFHRRLLALGASAYAEDDPVLRTILGHARAVADATLDRAKVEAGDLLSEAEQQAQDLYRVMLGDLPRQREELERRVTDLRAFESEYRARLIAYHEGQLADLRAGSEDRAVAESEPENGGGGDSG